MKEEDTDSVDKDYKPHKIPSRMAGKIPESEKNGRRSRRHPDPDTKTDTQVGFGSEDEVSGGWISVHGLKMPWYALFSSLLLLKL